MCVCTCIVQYKHFYFLLIPFKNESCMDYLGYCWCNRLRCSKHNFIFIFEIYEEIVYARRDTQLFYLFAIINYFRASDISISISLNKRWLYNRNDEEIELVQRCDSQIEMLVFMHFIFLILNYKFSSKTTECGYHWWQSVR